MPSRQGDRRHAHAPSSRVAPYLGSFCRAFVNKFLNTASSDDEDEADHDMRLGEEILGPPAAAAAEVPRVEVPTEVAPERTARQL